MIATISTPRCAISKQTFVNHGEWFAAATICATRRGRVAAFVVSGDEV
jgi:hypothetical protein